MLAQAAVTAEKGAAFAISDVEIDVPRADEVLVAVKAAGICHTDSAIRDQSYPVPLPAVLGHEGAGIVEAVGTAVRKVAPGDHVIMSYASCGLCGQCSAGRPWLCDHFWDRNFGGARDDGSTALTCGGRRVGSHFFGQSSFATYAMATERNVTKVPEDVPLEIVAPFGCGIQTGAGAILNALRPPAGSSIAVFGTGTVGLAAIAAARLAGCTTIIGVDVWPSRLQLAREMGATHVVKAGAEDALEAIDEATAGVGAAFSIDATGIPEVLRQAVYCLASGGQCGLIGGPPAGTHVSLDMNEILTRGRVLHGIIEGHSTPDVFLPTLIGLWRQGRFPIDRIITPYPFAAIDEAARDAEQGIVVKPVLLM